MTWPNIFAKCSHPNVYFVPYGAVCRAQAQAEWCGDCGQLTIFHDKNGATVLNPIKVKEIEE